MKNPFRQRFLVQINYKSGISVEIWMYEFSIDSGQASWQPVTDHHKPIILGVDDVESVYQIGYKRWGFI